MKTKDLFEKSSYDTGVSVDVMISHLSTRVGTTISISDFGNRDHVSNILYKLPREDAYHYMDQLTAVNDTLEKEITELSIAFRNMIAVLVAERLDPIDNQIVQKAKSLETDD